MDSQSTTNEVHVKKMLDWLEARPDIKNLRVGLAILTESCAEN